jgi:hypothetical protein
MSEHLDRFKQGWLNEDLDMILNACAEDFVFDDPVDGRITKARFADYYGGLPEGALVFSDEAVQEAGGVETHWWWWALKGPGETEWAQEGTTLVRADADGVHAQRIACYKR